MIGKNRPAFPAFLQRVEIVAVDGEDVVQRLADGREEIDAGRPDACLSQFGAGGGEQSVGVTVVAGREAKVFNEGVHPAPPVNQNHCAPMIAKSAAVVPSTILRSGA